MNIGRGVFIKNHWLYGDIYMMVKVDMESPCSKCKHWGPCPVDMQKFCLNYDEGRSDLHPGCNNCIHRFTRFDKDEDKIPCFACRWFEEGPRTVEKKIGLVEVRPE
jgi:hypothetical protein